MTTIKFGTDGWRAIIGEDFIPENITQIIQAFADIYPSLPEAHKPLYIGYDRRAKSQESAELIAKVLVGNGIKAILSKQFSPTPCVSWHVKNDRAAAGIMVTASHNPPQWNGIKFKESYGGAASPKYTDPIEAQIAKNKESGKKPKIGRLPDALCETFDPKGPYVKHLKTWANLKLIKDCKFKILADPMYGAGTDFFPEFFEDAVTQIHTAADTNFGGIQPEPILPNVNEAIEAMKSRKYDICVITDGDADRIGAIDEKGTFVTSHQIFSLLIKHIVETRKWKGRIIKSITTTQMINRLCKKYGLELLTTPVGFKHISPALNEPNVLMGGEESGGIGFPRHVCERDGILCGLLLV
ncbi:MAG: phosphoglucomutase/phosphomannomutase family protein [Deltaproteobacteria bacterium]|nr:phosphoglucomutase/phosphomannomutase family protein [Deltaproteobacteria bacterium]